ncbi:RAMP superfamily CRISPR-associated protein [Dethiothermospora halolimnae]|uniref:RAMP superfamily CRISPR-associated protein n=1 Tax=Dethiothermospora halolimnae TaxID=3114390 RepID=UPI003CCBBAC5
MSSYKIRVELLSEGIFNSGEEQKNSVNNKVLTDKDGFVCYHAKTLKGVLKERGELIGKNLLSISSKADIIEDLLLELFGSRFNDNSISETKKGIMNLSNLEINGEVKKIIKEINILDSESDGYKGITKYDLIEAQTNIRTHIQLEEGIIKDKRLGSYHTVKNGLIFISDINFDREPAKDQVALLNIIVNSLDYIGGCTNRGRGKVKAVLLKDDKEVSIEESLEVILGE